MSNVKLAIVRRSHVPILIRPAMARLNSRTPHEGGVASESRGDELQGAFEYFQHFANRRGLPQLLVAIEDDVIAVSAIRTLCDSEQRRIERVAKYGECRNRAFVVDCVVPPFAGRNASAINLKKLPKFLTVEEYRLSFLIPVAGKTMHMRHAVGTSFALYLWLLEIVQLLRTRLGWAAQRGIVYLTWRAPVP